MDRTELIIKYKKQQAYLDYLKMASRPESAKSIQQAQNFLDGMLTIQTLDGHSEQDVKQLSQEIMDLAKE